MENYEKQAQDFLEKTSSSLKIEFLKNGKHFTDDKDVRDIYKVTLSRGSRSYTFNFGQSILIKGAPPTAYDILTCLQKYDIGSFEDFCFGFGYDEDSRRAEKIYNSVVEEYNALCMLYSDNEMEMLQEIQ